MFASLLPVVTVVALGLLVPASVAAMLLARGRHASASSGGDRRGRVAVATVLVAVAGGSVGVAVGAGPFAVAVACLLLAAPVLAWAALAPWWPVRAVVAWAMLVTGSVGLVGIATSRALESSLPWSSLPVAAVGAAFVVFVLGRLNGPFRRVLGIRAGIRRAVRTPLFLRPALLRPALALAVFFAAMAVGGLTGVAPGPGAGRGPQAGPSTGPSAEPGAVDGSKVRPVSADTTTPSGSAPGVGAWSPYDGSRGASGPAGTGAAVPFDGFTATGGGTDGGTSTPAGIGLTADSSTADSSTGTPGETPHQAIATDSSGPSESPDPTETGRTAPVTTVNDTVKDVTGPVNQVTDPVKDDGQENTEPVRTVVEDTTEPVKTVVEDTTDPVKTVVEDTTDPVKTVVEDTTDPVKTVVEDTTDPVKTVVEDTTKSVTDPIGSVLP